MHNIPPAHNNNTFFNFREEFDSTINTSIMRAVLKLQEAIYDQYSLLAYVKIEPGSSWLELIPAPILKAVSEKIKKMTNKELLSVIAAVAIGSTVFLGTTKVIEGKNKIAELEAQSKVLTDVQKNTTLAMIRGVQSADRFL